MPQTIEQVTIAATARVITEHFPQQGRKLCYCDKEWTPRHVAKALYAAGLLGWTRDDRCGTCYGEGTVPDFSVGPMACPVCKGSGAMSS